MSFTLFQNTKKCVKLKIKPKMTLNDLKWPLGDLCGKSWSLITKITMASDSLTPKTYIKWCHLSFLYFLIFTYFWRLPIFKGREKYTRWSKKLITIFFVFYGPKRVIKTKIRKWTWKSSRRGFLWQNIIHYISRIRSSPQITQP